MAGRKKALSAEVKEAKFHWMSAASREWGYSGEIGTLEQIEAGDSVEFSGSVRAENVELALEAIREQLQRVGPDAYIMRVVKQG